METKMFKAHRGGVFDFRKRPRKWNLEVNDAMVINSSLGNKIPDYDTRLAIDLYVTELKDIGVWSSLDTFVLFALNDTELDDFSLYDYKRGVFYTAFGGVTFTNEGWEGNGVDGYIDTNFNPATMGVNYTLNDASRGAVVSKTGTISATPLIIDSVVSTNQNTLRAGNYNFHRINQTTNNLNASADLSGIGFKVIIRQTSTNVMLVNKDVEINRTSSSTVVAAGNQHLLSSNTGFSELSLSTYFMAASLTYAQTQDFRTATNNYLTAIGLNPIA